MSSDHPARTVRARIEEDTGLQGKGKTVPAPSLSPGTAQVILARDQAALDEDVADRAKHGQHLRLARLRLLLEVLQSREQRGKLGVRGRAAAGAKRVRRGSFRLARLGL